MREQVEVLIDRDNAVEIELLGIQLEAIEDKIIVIVDMFRSGFECATCNGTGQVKSTVNPDILHACDSCKGKGALLVIPEIAKSLPTLGTVVSVGEGTKWARHLEEVWFFEQETNDDGLYSAEEWLKHKATQKTEIERRERKIKVRPGARVLFSPHVGTLIPFKGNIRLKIMREHEPLNVIYGAKIDSKNFLDYENPNAEL